MKNGLLIWNVVLTLLVGYLLFLQFGGKKSGSDPLITKRSGNDTFISNIPFKIAYFEMDSVENNFQVVKTAKALINKREEDINAEMSGLARNLQQRLSYFQEMAKTGSMSQAQREAADQELKGLDEQMQSRKQVLDQDYNEFVTRRMNDIKTKIEDFLKEYNKDRKYSYIVAFEQGLFYYKDSAYNITGDVIQGLNEMYKNKKQ